LLLRRYKNRLAAYKNELATSALQYPNDMYGNSAEYIKEYETQVQHCNLLHDHWLFLLLFNPIVNCCNISNFIQSSSYLSHGLLFALRNHFDVSPEDALHKFAITFK